DQGVAEAEGAGGVAALENFAADQRGDGVLDRGLAEVVAGEGMEAREAEVLAEDAGDAEQEARQRVELSEARLEHRHQRLGHGVVLAGGRRLDELPEMERVSRRTGDDARDDVGAERAPHAGRDETLAGARAERAERQLLEELRAPERRKEMLHLGA